MIKKLFFQGNENSFISFLQDKKYTQIILIADANTNGFCNPVLKKILPIFNNSSLIVIPQGESNKTLETCSFIWNQLESLQADRSSLIVNVGGGMVSDIGGFAASVYKRGIDFINIPTTLLAMVDACYGGKTAIDFNGIKNNIGMFQHPVAIYIHTSFLITLNHKTLKSGIAETMKHAIISSTNWWNELIHFSEEEFYSLSTIQKSLQIKIDIVLQDERDYGIRQTLNFGHTVGHAIESFSLTTSTPLLHGEAIILGMMHELKISEAVFNLNPKTSNEFKVLTDILFPNQPFQYTFDDIKSFLKHDKKNNEGIRMSLLSEVGNCAIQISVSEKQIQDSFNK